MEIKNIKFPSIDFLKYQALFIDLDDTLYDYTYYHSLTIKHCFNAYKWSFSNFESWELAYKKKREEITRRLNNNGSCRSRLFAFQEMAEEHKIPQAFDFGLAMENTYWRFFLDHITPFPQAESFLSEARFHNLKICVVTDMQHHIQIQKLQSLKLNSHIDYLVSSDLVGIEKPNEKIFQVAIEKVNTTVDKIIMVGDSIDKDIKGAQALGIKALIVS